MKLKILSILLLSCLYFNCKNDAKKETPAIEKEASKIPSVEKEHADPITRGTDDELMADNVIYSGVWTHKDASSKAEVVLNQNNSDVHGSFTYKLLDDKGNVKSTTGPISLKGIVQNEVLKVDILSENGEKMASATLTQVGNNLTFKSSGKKGKYPETFTVTKKGL